MTTNGGKAPADPASEEARYRRVLALDPNEPAAVPTLVAHLGDPSWRVRKAAVIALRGCRGQPTLLPALIAGLASDDNAGLRNACSEALVEAGSESVEELIGALASHDPDHRRFVVEALGAIGGDAAREALVRILDDSDGTVRSAVAEALGRIGGPAAIDPLRRRLADASTDLMERAYLLDALARSRTRLPFEDLEPLTAVPALARQAYALLGLSEDPRAGPLLVAGIEAPAAQTSAVAARSLVSLLPTLGAAEYEALRCLLQAGSRRQRLEALLGDPDDEVAAAAVRLLGVVGDSASAAPILRASACRPVVELATTVVASMGPTVIGPLLEAFDAEDIESRVLFLEVVEAVGDPGVVPRLFEIASGPDTRSAETALRVAGVLGRPDAIEPLIEAARRAGPDLARIAGMALAELGSRHPEEVAAAVREALDSGDARPEWVVVLGMLGRDEEIDHVAEAAHHRDADVRCAALEAAAAFGSTFPEEAVAYALTDEHPMVRVAAAKALGAYRSERAVDTLLAAAQDPDPWVVAEVIRSLGATNLPRVADTVMAAAGSASSPIAIAALQSLFRLNPPGLADAVRRALRHADAEVVREAVALSLRLPDDAAREVLAECLGHRAWNVRIAAAESLLSRKLGLPASLVEDRLAAESEPLVQEALERLLLLGVA